MLSVPLDAGSRVAVPNRVPGASPKKPATPAVPASRALMSPVNAARLRVTGDGPKPNSASETLNCAELIGPDTPDRSKVKKLLHSLP